MTRRRFTRAMILFTVLVVSALAAVYFGVRWGIRERVRDRCRVNLRSLVLAIHDHQMRTGRLPAAYVNGPDGRPWHSWRVLILPDLGRKDLYDAYRFDEPWNGPNNSKLIEQMPEVFGCPADHERNPGKTSYLALVGSQTAWPGDRSTTLEELTSADGTAGTILLVETAAPEIAWTEPRDMTMRELFPDMNEDGDTIGPRFSSKHHGMVMVAMADSGVRSIRYPFRVENGPEQLLSMATAWSGRPYKGKWLPGEEPIETQQFPPEAEAEKLRSTDVVSHQHGRMAPQRNVIWCATIQIAWDELRQENGGTLTVKDCEPAEGLNKTPFPRDALDAGSHVSKMGNIGSGIKQKIADDMGRKFPGMLFRLSESTNPTDFIVFGFLQKNLPFQVRFDNLRDPLRFRSPSGEIGVKSFGFKTLKEARFHDSVGTQVEVLTYRSDDDFVIKLNSKTDEIVLAKVEPAASMRETLTMVKKRIAESEQVRPKIEDNETLIVPKLAFNVLRTFNEFRGKFIADFKAGGDANMIEDARQSVRFMLNARGARIESAFDASLVGNGHDKPPPPPKPRRFILDKPFLLYVKEARAEEPYMVVWVANGEIMEAMNN